MPDTLPGTLQKLTSLILIYCRERNQFSPKNKNKNKAKQKKTGGRQSQCILDGKGEIATNKITERIVEMIEVKKI